MISAMMIFEIMGRPAPYIRETLSNLVDKIGNEKGCVIGQKKIFDPKAIEGYQNFFSTFAEVEIEFAGIEDFIRILLTYLPSHIDILKPQYLPLSNNELNFLANHLASKMHQYDEIAKGMLIENENLKKQIVLLKEEKKDSGKIEEKKKKTRRKKRKEKITVDEDIEEVLGDEEEEVGEKNLEVGEEIKDIEYGVEDGEDEKEEEDNDGEEEEESGDEGREKKGEEDNDGEEEEESGDEKS